MNGRVSTKVDMSLKVQTVISGNNLIVLFIFQRTDRNFYVRIEKIRDEEQEKHNAKKSSQINGIYPLS